MSRPPSEALPRQEGEPLPAFEGLPAWVVFCAVVLAEYLLVSFCFDARELLGPAGLQSVIGHIGSVAPLAFVVVATTVITGGAAPRAALECLSPFRLSRRASASCGVLHLGAYAGALLLARHITGGNGVGLALARSSFALWVLLGALSVGTAALALWELSTLVRAVRIVRSSLLVGAIVGVLAWGAGQVAQVVWDPLAWLTLELVHALLTLVASDPVASVEHQLVGTSRFFVHIAPICSGIEGIGLMLSFMAAFLYIERRELRWPSALVLLPLTTAFIWLLNVVRITALVAVGTWASPHVALGGFHSKAGWVLFTAAALGTVVFVKESALFRLALPRAAEQSAASSAPRGESRASAPTTKSSTSGEAAYLLPLLSVLAVSLVSGLATTEFDYFYPLRVVVAAGVLYKFRAHYPPLRIDAPWLGLTAGVLLAVVWILGFQRTTGASEPSTGAELAAMSPTSAGLWLAFRFVGGVLTVPLVEELAFRGYLMRRFNAREFERVPFERSGWLGLVVSSVAFGALHSQWLLGLLAGVVFGLLARARGRLSDAIVAHAVSNLGLFAYVLATGEWTLLG